MEIASVGQPSAAARALTCRLVGMSSSRATAACPGSGYGIFDCRGYRLLCINVSGTALVSVYETEGDGATLTKSMRTLDNVPKSIVTNAMPVISTYETDERTIDQGTRTISNVLLSSPESYTCAFGSDEVESTGSQPLMTFTTELRYIDNEAHRNFVLACGTTEFVSEKYIGRST